MAKVQFALTSEDSGSGSQPPSPASTKRLADLLLEVARYVHQDVAAVLPSRFEKDLRLDALRSVLLEQEQVALARLQRKIDDPREFAAAVSGVLAEAFAQAAARDDAMGKLLAPALEKAAQASIRKDPGILVGIVYPLMGPAIRKSIAESLDGTLHKLNQAFKHSFSLQGLKWRLEAMRTGTSFADVVLNHTVEYSVEHIFLIHKKTGLLLEHVAAPDAASQDPQLVSGMLTAIQDFMRDSFQSAGGGEARALDAVRLGDLLLWCEEGAFAFLAAVIRGNPPESLHATLRERLSRLHEDLRIPLEEFAGDTAPFANVAARLEPCLEKRELPEAKRLSPWLWALPLAILVIAGVWGVLRFVEGRRIDSYVQSLRAEPGIVVTDVERRGGAWQISGLRDPLAVDPATLLAQSKLNPSHVVSYWEPYQALDPAMVLRRFTATLEPPRSVSFVLDGGTIRAEGSAPQHWTEHAKTLISQQPAGAVKIDLSAVTDIQDPTFVRLRDAIQAHVIKFNPNAPRPAPDQDAGLDALAREIGEMNQVASNLGFSVRVMIVGHTDITGSEMANLSLSAARAEVVRSMMRARGIAPEQLLVRSTGTLEPLEFTGQENLSMNRSVTFTVSTSD